MSLLTRRHLGLLLKVLQSITNFQLSTIIFSLSNKLDLIESELRDFDVICLTETWLDQRISDETLKNKRVQLIPSC